MKVAKRSGNEFWSSPNARGSSCAHWRTGAMAQHAMAPGSTGRSVDAHCFAHAPLRPDLGVRGQTSCYRRSGPRLVAGTTMDPLPGATNPLSGATDPLPRVTSALPRATDPLHGATDPVPGGAGIANGETSGTPEQQISVFCSHRCEKHNRCKKKTVCI